MTTHRALPMAALLFAPLLGGADGDGCTTFSESPAPDMAGDWRVGWNDDLEVEIEIGGAVYTETLGAAGGTVAIEGPEGQPLMFDLDCSREEVVCPSEVWETDYAIRQDDERFPHRIWLQVPQTRCTGELVPPDMSLCGEGTNNPNCDMVCMGDVAVETVEAYGIIDEPGETFSLFLGAGVATNGVNCLLIGGSVAEGTLETSGSAETEDWYAESIPSGEVITEYGGGCLWAGDVDMDDTLEALILGARVRFTTTYCAARR